MPLYRTHFTLLNPVCDVTDAAGYLTEDDMSVFLRDRLADGPWRDVPDGLFPDGAAAVFYIVWNLQTEQHGCVDLYTSRLLTPDELGYVSDWVKGQCSDGLGEGFEQQDFACYLDEEALQGAQDDHRDQFRRWYRDKYLESYAEENDITYGEAELDVDNDELYEMYCQDNPAPSEADEDFWLEASFDWQSNPYTFSRVC